MKIAILNQPLANRGDEAAHKAFIRQLSKALPESHIDVLFLCEKVILIDAIKIDGNNIRYINIPKLKFEGTIQKYSFLFNAFFLSYLHPSLFKFRNALKHYDKVICAPGGICMGGFLNWNHIWQLTVAKRLHKSIFYWARSIGPFTEEDFAHSIFKKRSYELLKYFSYTSLRDEISVGISKKIGINTNEVVDSAFLEIPNASVPKSLKNQIGDDFVVFVPNQLTWHYRYKKIQQERIDRFYLEIISLVEKKFPDRKIVMLPQIYKSEVDDCKYFKHLKEKSNSTHIIVIDENQNSDIQQKIISSATFVIGARYHSVVFAINNCIPFVSLSYEHKMTGLLEKLNLKKQSVEIQDIFDSRNEEAQRSALDELEEKLSETGTVDIYTGSKNPQKIVSEGFDLFVNALRSGKYEGFNSSNIYREEIYM